MRTAGASGLGRSDAAPPGSPGRTRPEAAALVAFVIFVPMALLSAAMCWVLGRPVGLVALLAVPVLPMLRSRPAAAAVTVVAAGTVFRVALVGSAPVTDQIETIVAAFRLVLAGGNPYGAGIAGTSTGAPFPYGPLALVAYVPGVWTEVIAATITMSILARTGTSVGLAVYAACPLLVRATVMGTNDVLPGLLITAAVLVLPTSRRWSGAVLAAAIAVKPYAGAWLPGLLGAGGLEFGLVFAGVSLLAWSPLLRWGVPAFVTSLRLAEAQHPASVGALDVGWARWLAVPIALVSFARARSTDAQVAYGTAIFAVVLFLGQWFSLAYVLAPLPLLLIVVERMAYRWAAARRRTSAAPLEASG
jgi:hypothetical protein